MSSKYEERARTCVEKALAGLGLSVALETWHHPATQGPELVVVVRGSCALSTVEIQKRGLLAFEEEFSDIEPWPMLAMYTNGDREESAEQSSNFAAS